MKHLISLSSYSSQTLSKVPLKTLKQLIKAGAVSISSFDKISLPSPTTIIYLYLQNLIKSKKNNKFSLQQFEYILDKLIIDPFSVSQRKASAQNLNEQLAPLQDQIIEAIVDLQPTIFQRYSVDYIFGHQKRNQQELKIKIQMKNQYCIHNLVKLCLKILNNLQNTNVIRQTHSHLFQGFIFPIFISFVQLSSLEQKRLFESIKNMLVLPNSSQFQKYISQLFSDFYCDFWVKHQFLSQDLKIVSLLERHIKLLEIIHYNIPYNRQLADFGLFKDHLKKLMSFTGENKGSFHLLAMNLYQKLAKNCQQYNATTQIFGNLFNILSCYGVHLIKDIWPSFYSLVSNQQASIFSSLQLIEIILCKLEYHQNANVIKHCLHQLLKNTQSNILFEKAPSIIYKKIIPMLNLGVHYVDCKFHMDSKVYPLISSFFLRYFNSPTNSKESLTQHLQWFLAATLALPNNDHALIALLMVLKDLNRRSNWIGVSEVQQLRNLITRAYSRYPIRKRYQMIDSILRLLSQQIDQQNVPIEDVFQLFIQINQQYLLQLNFNKFLNILNRYNSQRLEKYFNEEIQNIILSIKNNSVFQNQLTCSRILDSIRKIEFLVRIAGNLSNIQKQLKQAFTFYTQYFANVLQQYGQSLYKTTEQREFVIITYSIIQQKMLSSFNLTKTFSAHLQAVLNLVALLVSHQSNQESKLVSKQASSKIYQIVYKLFFRAYAFNKEEQYIEREGERVILARMFQWAYDNIHSQIGYDVVIAATRARINVNTQKQFMKEQYTKYQNLFQQTLYQMFNELQELQQQNWKAVNYFSPLSRDKQLRLYTLTSSILLTDVAHQIYIKPPNSQFLAEIIDRYDFQHYEEVCWLIELVYCRWPCEQRPDEIFIQRNDQQQLKLLVRQLQILLENMVHNLEYSLQKKQILSICQVACSILFRNIRLNHKISTSLANFIIQLIKIGQNYLIFHRAVTLTFIQGLIDHFQDIVQSNFDAIISLLVELISVQEYRGFDSAVYCYSQNHSYSFYRAFNSDLQYNYYGTVPRFLFIHSFQKQILKNYKTPKSLKFYGQIISRCIEIALAVVAKQKMFLSGKNKIKLQIWQFLLAFQPQQIFQSLKVQKINQILVRCVEMMGENSISEIRYYFQIFMMKILLTESLFRCITNQALCALKQGLINFFGNVNRSVSFMITSGILIKHISNMSAKDNEHFLSIKQSFVNLYNSLLTYVCSAVAYFRGISQYFCLQDISGCLQTKYVSILRQNYLQDPDANILRQKISVITASYLADIKNWEVSKEVLCKIPNQNHNVVCGHYYMDVFKKIGTELANTVKNQDGFTAYRYIWKKNVTIGQKEEIELENQQQVKNEEVEEDQAVFQRKIDPSLQFIYGNQTRSHLRLFVASAKSVALIGHLARTGQIFGIQQLIIPDIKTLDLDSFKSISVTAQRWLKITEWSNTNDHSRENAFKALLKCKTEGYQIIKLSKNRKKQLKSQFQIQLKTVLVLDEQQWLPEICWNLVDKQLEIGKYLSCHVEASIFIWSYFKRYVNIS